MGGTSNSCPNYSHDCDTYSRTATDKPTGSVKILSQVHVLRTLRIVFMGESPNVTFSYRHARIEWDFARFSNVSSTSRPPVIISHLNAYEPSQFQVTATTPATLSLLPQNLPPLPQHKPVIRVIFSVQYLMPCQTSAYLRIMAETQRAARTI